MSSLSGNGLQKRRRKQQPVQSKTDAETALHSHAKRKSTCYNLSSSVFFSSILALAWYFLLYDPDISQESTWRNTSASPFDIVDLPDRGKGAVANRDIDQGELLIREAPLFTVPSSINESPTALLSRLISQLHPAQMESFFALTHVAPPANIALSTDDATLAIFQTNAIAAGNSVGLFPMTARLNHACAGSFNSVYSWREKEGVLVLHASKPVKRGQELLTAYMDTKTPRMNRRQYLKEHYGFHCTCDTCSLSETESLASDRRLSKIAGLYRTFSSWASQSIEGDEAIKIAQQIWDLSEEEEYFSERGRLAADAVHVAAAHSDRVGVEQWAELALRWSSMELGEDSDLAQELREISAHPASHIAWATRRVIKVGSPGQR